MVNTKTRKERRIPDWLDLALKEPSHKKRRSRESKLAEMTEEGAILNSIAVKAYVYGRFKRNYQYLLSHPNSPDARKKYADILETANKYHDSLLMDAIGALNCKYPQLKAKRS
jgi:hypothetical protein